MNMLALMPIVQQLVLEGYKSRRAQAATGASQPPSFMPGAVIAGYGATAATLALALLFAFVGVIFLLIALQAYLEPEYGVSEAWFITGTAAFLASALLCFVNMARRRFGNRIKKIAASVAPDPSAIHDFSVMRQILDDATAPIKDHPVTSVLVAAIIGAMAGDKIHDK